MAIVRVQNITMDFGSVTALKDFTLESENGEFLVILGPAGAGKTTLLKVIAGLYRPTYGRVFLDGNDVTDLPGNKRNVAMTFEDYALYPTFTVYENLNNPFGAAEVKFKKQEIEEKISEVASMLQIDHLLDRNVDQLSGGQKQRVSLARSIVRSPQVFLFDEPLSHVDAKIRNSMRSELHRLSTTLSTTTIYVTHDYVEALSLADRIVVINEGQILQIGSPHEIYEKPKDTFVAKMVGQPNINLIRYQVFSEDNKLKLHDPADPGLSFFANANDKEILTPYIGEQVTIGIRPQDINYSFSPVNGAGYEKEVVLFELWGRRGMMMIMKGDNNPLRILTGNDEPVNPGRKIWLDFSSSKLHIFNSAGIRIN